MIFALQGKLIQLFFSKNKVARYELRVKSYEYLSALAFSCSNPCTNTNSLIITHGICLDKNFIKPTTCLFL
jgi:hypothetical protein